jgi:hypothetical protein
VEKSNILPNGVFQTFSDWLIVFKKSDSNRQHFVQRWALVLNLPLIKLQPHLIGCTGVEEGL